MQKETYRSPVKNFSKASVEREVEMRERETRLGMVEPEPRL